MVGTYSGTYVLCTTLLAAGILPVVSLTPLYPNNSTQEADGEREYKSASMNDIVLHVLLLSI